MSALVDRFLRLHAYERDCGPLVIESLDSIPDDHRGDGACVRAMNTAAHIQAARLEWFWRLRGGSDRPESIFFTSSTIGEVEQLTAAADGAWESYFDELTEQELLRLAEFQDLRGMPHHCRVDDILTHLSHHAAYHRGQIAMLVKQATGKPGVTDFILFARREPEGA